MRQGLNPKPRQSLVIFERMKDKEIYFFQEGCRARLEEMTQSEGKK